MRLGLANRFALIFSLLVLVATATVGYFVFRGARHSLIVASTDRLADNAEIVATRFNAALDGVAEDVRFLAGTPPVDGLARIYSARRRGLSLDPKTAMSDTEWRALLSDVFRGFLANRPMYRAVHLVALDRGGSELGRAERQAGEIVWVPTSELERLGEEEVVREGSTLGRDTLYVSNITFAGGDTGAAVPVLQAALPIYGPTGDAFGLLILDVDVRPILSTLSSLLTSDKSLYLADSEGTVLVRPIDEVDPAAAPARLQALFPDVDPLLDGEERSIRIEQTRVGPQRVVSAYFERFAVGVGTGMDDLVVGVTSPHEAILGGVRQVRTRSFIITVLFGFSGILFALAFARHLTRPLRRITRALSSFGRGEWAEELPVDRRDEIGLLATTFVEMADQIQQQVVELEQKELRQRTILETSAEGIIVTDADGVVETFNPAAAVILGVSPAEALGRRIDTMIKAADAPDRDGAAGPVPGLHPGREAVGVRPDGSQVPLDVTWSTFDLHGRTRVTLLVQDVSERKTAEAMREQLLAELRLERERLQRLSESLEERVRERTADLARSNKTLEQRNRELQDFAYVASHDLQEPLRKIRAFADLLKADHGSALPEEGAFYVERMQDAAERMSRLISDLLDFSRVMTRARPFERVDLNDIAEDVLSDLELRCRETGAEVSIGALPSLDAERSQMARLLQNLISNGLKFHREGVPPRIEVRGGIDPDARLPGISGPVAYIEVEDNGIGFDEKYLDRIFSPFQRLHGQSDYSGTGMGLTICRRIAEHHEGTITARSTPGEGSTFIVHLPVRQERKEAAAAQEAAVVPESAS